MYYLYRYTVLQLYSHRVGGLPQATNSNMVLELQGSIGLSSAPVHC